MENDHHRDIYITDKKAARIIIIIVMDLILHGSPHALPVGPGASVPSLDARWAALRGVTPALRAAAAATPRTFRLCAYVLENLPPGALRAALAPWVASIVLGYANPALRWPRFVGTVAPLAVGKAARGFFLQLCVQLDAHAPPDDVRAEIRELRRAVDLAGCARGPPVLARAKVAQSAARATYGGRAWVADGLFALVSALHASDAAMLRFFPTCVVADPGAHGRAAKPPTADEWEAVVGAVPRVGRGSRGLPAAVRAFCARVFPPGGGDKAEHPIAMYLTRLLPNWEARWTSQGYPCGRAVVRRLRRSAPRADSRALVWALMRQWEGV
jgi:hypothetical protein